jgi:2-polyprenyl-3-methyl-5-hydroxy-6-metoxy-1,4-benzoquinol methylase
MSRQQAEVTRQRVIEIMQGYRNTALLRTGIDLGVFGALAEGPRSAAELGARLETDERGMTILLNALTAIGLLRADGGAFQLASGVDKILVPGEPGYVGAHAKILASDWEWDALKTLDAAVRHGGAVVDEHAETPNFAYWEDFASYATLATGPTSDLVVDALRPWLAERDTVEVLDMACGHGLYGYTLAKAEPKARVTSLDWPNVVPIAAGQAEKLGVRDRVSFLEGDMFEVPLGGPYDVVYITNVLHHFSAEQAGQLVARAHGALRPGGRLVVVGFTVGDEAPDVDPAPHLFSVLMLAWTGGGQVHTEREYDEMLRGQGFRAPSVHALPGVPMKVLIAERD